MTEEPGGRPRSNRRDNGLAAAAYVPLAELDPRLADAMLTALRDAGVAAYATPSTGTTGGYLEVSLPDRPADRVWVDSTERQRASALLADLGGGAAAQPAAPEEDESWRVIVATFQTPATGAAAWPAAEEVGEEDPATERAGTGEAADDDEHYVPPEPPPLPQPHPVTRWAVLAFVGGLGVLIVPAVFGEPVGPGLALLAVLAVVGGFVTLVARMRDAPPTDSGPDDGAVV